LCLISTFHRIIRVENTTLDAIDRQIIHILTIAPRSSFRTIAEVTGISDQTAARRYRKLSESAGLRVLGVVNGPRSSAMRCSCAGCRRAMLWLTVEPSQLDATGRALAGHPEVPFAAATTGPANLIVSALFRDTQHLYEYLTGPLAALPGVTSVQTAPIIRTLKRTGSLA
jgi:DNA-binding Lrp family transcriptional regulator